MKKGKKKQNNLAFFFYSQLPVCLNYLPRQCCVEEKSKCIKTLLLRIFYGADMIFLKCGLCWIFIEALTEVCKWRSLGFYLGQRLIELESPLCRGPQKTLCYITSSVKVL